MSNQLPASNFPKNSTNTVSHSENGQTPHVKHEYETLKTGEECCGYDIAVASEDLSLLKKAVSTFDNNDLQIQQKFHDFMCKCGAKLDYKMFLIEHSYRTPEEEIICTVVAYGNLCQGPIPINNHFDEGDDFEKSDHFTEFVIKYLALKDEASVKEYNKIANKLARFSIKTISMTIDVVAKTLKSVQK